MPHGHHTNDDKKAEGGGGRGERWRCAPQAATYVSSRPKDRGGRRGVEIRRTTTGSNRIERKSCTTYGQVWNETLPALFSLAFPTPPVYLPVCLSDERWVPRLQKVFTKGHCPEQNLPTRKIQDRSTPPLHNTTKDLCSPSAFCF